MPTYKNPPVFAIVNVFVKEVFRFLFHLQHSILGYMVFSFFKVAIK